MQPFCYNDLHPCMLIDHPEVIKRLVKRYGANPTHKGAESLVNELNGPLLEYSRKVEEIYHEVWNTEYQWVKSWQKTSVCM